MRHPIIEQSVLFGDTEKLVLCLKGFDCPGQLAGSHRGCADWGTCSWLVGGAAGIPGWHSHSAESVVMPAPRKDPWVPGSLW